MHCRPNDHLDLGGVTTSSTLTVVAWRTVCAQALEGVESARLSTLSSLTATPSPAWPAVGFAGDTCSTTALAQALQDFQALDFAGVRPALDLACGTHAAEATPCFRIKRADTDAGRRDIDQEQPHKTERVGHLQAENAMLS